MGIDELPPIVRIISIPLNNNAKVASEHLQDEIKKVIQKITGAQCDKLAERTTEESYLAEYTQVAFNVTSPFSGQLVQVNYLVVITRERVDLIDILELNKISTS